MTRFTPKFFSSGTGVLQKHGAHRRLGEVIVHFWVTGLAGFRAYIFRIDLFGLFVPDLFGLFVICRCFLET
jgi:hypothetical protein